MYASIVQQVNDIFIINNIKNQIDRIVGKVNFRDLYYDNFINLHDFILDNLKNFEKIQIKRLQVAKKFIEIPILQEKINFLYSLLQIKHDYYNYYY